ncbi:uncharacterized protein J3R85_008154 [Psidium guajava]|nr:uncharacterized protein J3R85_008154 [Psidium guajava]
MLGLMLVMNMVGIRVIAAATLVHDRVLICTEVLIVRMRRLVVVVMGGKLGRGSVGMGVMVLHREQVEGGVRGGGIDVVVERRRGRRDGEAVLGRSGRGRVEIGARGGGPGGGDKLGGAGVEAAEGSAAGECGIGGGRRRSGRVRLRIGGI